MISVTKLKKKYSHPIRAIECRCQDNDYCVGGALCREVGIDKSFPDEIQIKDAFLKANRRIDWHALDDAQRDNIYRLIHEVINANDRGNFPKAWDSLGELLRYQP